VLQAERRFLVVWQDIRISPDHEASIRVGQVYDFGVKVLFVSQVVVGG
jgi:hypothetical protein